MQFRENRLEIVVGGGLQTILNTGREDRVLGWWVISVNIDAFEYGENIFPPIAHVIPKVGGRYIKPFFMDCDQSISVLADEVEVNAYAYNRNAVVVATALPVPAPGRLDCRLTETGYIENGDVINHPKWPCANQVTGWKGDPNFAAQLNVGVAGPGPTYFNVGFTDYPLAIPRGATFVSIVNVSGINMPYSLEWRIVP